jgi:hypothetical protein
VRQRGVVGRVTRGLSRRARPELYRRACPEWSRRACPEWSRRARTIGKTLENVALWGAAVRDIKLRGRWKEASGRAEPVEGERRARRRERGRRIVAPDVAPCRAGRCALVWVREWRPSSILHLPSSHFSRAPYVRAREWRVGYCRAAISRSSLSAPRTARSRRSCIRIERPASDLHESHKLGVCPGRNELAGAEVRARSWNSCAGRAVANKAAYPDTATGQFLMPRQG